MNITVVGTGYVGLITGTCFAEMGNNVTCVDIDEQKVQLLSSGQIPIHEPNLSTYFSRNLQEERLRFTTSLEEALPGSDVVFHALPTPANADGSADVTAVVAVAKELGALIDGYTVVVNKSTVPVGTADRVRKIIESSGLVPGIDFDVVSNPEFLREGSAVEDFMKPDRVVIGTSSQRAADVMSELYEPYVRSGNPILTMDERSAEMTKYAANAMLAARISFMNEIANLCNETGADVEKVRRGIGSDARIGKHFLYAGCGFGGSCFPKDVKALHHTASEHGYTFHMLEAVAKVNDKQRALLAHQIADYFGGDLSGRRIAVWGLAFKANTDDVREAPSHVIIRNLLDYGAEVVAHDPEAEETTRQVLGDSIAYADHKYEPLTKADALVVCTEWNEFRQPNYERIRQELKQPVIFDGRNLYEPEEMAEKGFEYFSIGRPHVPSAPRKQTVSNGRANHVTNGTNGSSGAFTV